MIAYNKNGTLVGCAFPVQTYGRSEIPLPSEYGRPGRGGRGGGESAADANEWRHSWDYPHTLRSYQFVPWELFLFIRFFANPTHVWKLTEMWENINFFKTRMKLG